MFLKRTLNLLDSRHVFVKTPEGRWASDHNPIIAKLKF